MRELRLARGLSQEELAWEVDVAQGSISNYEIGRSDIPLSVLIAICHALDVSPDQLLPYSPATGHDKATDGRLAQGPYANLAGARRVELAITTRYRRLSAAS